jgi:hypothetical protein
MKSKASWRRLRRRFDAATMLPRTQTEELAVMSPAGFGASGLVQADVERAAAARARTTTKRMARMVSS